MTEPTKKTGFFQEFLDGFQEEFDKPNDHELSGKTVLEGLVEGAAETVVHPFRWLRTIIRSK